MSNDLLFSVLPRNTKVKIDSSAGVTKVEKDPRSDIVKEKREKQNEEQRADQEAAHERQFKQSDSESAADKSENENHNDDSDHLDVYI